MSYKAELSGKEMSSSLSPTCSSLFLSFYILFFKKLKRFGQFKILLSMEIQIRNSGDS